MSINPNCTLGGKLNSIHDEAITIKLHPDVEGYKAKLKENIMDTRRWLDYAVSLCSTTPESTPPRNALPLLSPSARSGMEMIAPSGKF